MRTVATFVILAFIVADCRATPTPWRCGARRVRRGSHHSSKLPADHGGGDFVA